MPTTVLPTTADTEVPTWKSPNELIHERINFDDTIWGFGLAGGAYYKTPLRITYVRPGSRAQMAHIYPGDVVLKINGIDSSTLTLEEAHRMILESGIHLKINVTSPEDLEDNYFYYQDPLADPSIEQLKAKEVKYKATHRFPKVLGKCSHWSLQWPWKCKRKIIYKESNCYLVPSKFEEKHKDTRKAEVKDDEIVLDSIHNVKGKKNTPGKQKNKNSLITSEKKNEANDKVDIKEGSESTEQLDSANKNDDNDKNKLVIQDGKDNVIENNASVDKNNEDSAKELNDTVDKSTKDIITEENNPADNTIEDHSAVHNDIKDDNNNVISEHNISVNKDDQDLIIKQNTSVDENDGNPLVEANSTLYKKDENLLLANDVSEHNDHNHDDNTVAANDNNCVDRTEENISIEASDLVDNNNVHSDRVKFENGDIPGINESEKLAHNSR